jgi:hypothetical protein
MSWPRLIAYLLILVVAYCEENDIPLGPLCWHYLTTALLKMSNLFWNGAIYSSQQYRKAIESNA